MKFFSIFYRSKATYKINVVALDSLYNKKYKNIRYDDIRRVIISYNIS